MHDEQTTQSVGLIIMSIIMIGGAVLLGEAITWVEERGFNFWEFLE